MNDLSNSGTLQKYSYHLDVLEPRLGGNAGGGPGSGCGSPEDFGLLIDDVDEDDPIRGGKGGGAEFLSSPSSDVGVMASVMSTLTGKNVEHVRLFCKVCGDFGGSGGATPGELSRLCVGAILSDWCLFTILSGGGTLFSDTGRCLRGGMTGGDASVLCSNGSSWSFASLGGVHK